MLLKVNRFGLSAVIILFALFVTLNCAPKTNTIAPAALAADVLGISPGMKKPDAENRLRQIAVFERDEPKRQQVWRLKDDPHFDHLALGYDADDDVLYVTALSDKVSTKQRLRYSEIGDLDAAKKEITGTHHTYSWEAAAANNIPAYSVVVYGDNPDYLLYYTLLKKADPNQSEEEEEERNGRGERQERPELNKPRG